MEALNVPGVLDSLRPVMDYVVEAGNEAELDTHGMYRLRLAVEEIATNIVVHGYKEAGLEGMVNVKAQIDQTTLTIVLEDTAAPYNPLEHKTPDSLTKPLEEREIGGLGVYLALQNVDDYHYERIPGANRNTLIFHRPVHSYNRDMIRTKTHQVDRVTGMYGLRMANLTHNVNLLGKIAEEIASGGSQSGQTLLQVTEKITHSLKETYLASEKIIDQLQQFQQLLDISGVISSSLELDLVLEYVMDTVITLTGAERAYLILRDPKSKGDDIQMDVHTARNRDGETLSLDRVVVSSKVIETALEKGRPIITSDAQHDDRFSTTESIMKLELRSIICIPLMLRGVLTGVLYADNQLKEGAFSEELVPLLTIFANQATTAIENARLFEKSRNETRLERELQIGQQIQAGFLPKDIPPTPGWEISGYFHPARRVAGDFYDVFTVGTDKIAFVVGDVCDKGLGAALFMALFRSLLRAFAQQRQKLSWMDNIFDDDTEKRTTSRDEQSTFISSGATELKNAIEMTNNYIAINHGDANMFATMFLAVVDPRSGTLRYINGGHNPPVLITAAGEIKAQFAPTGPAVGMLPDMQFTIKQAQFEIGDTLLIYTDGVTEARNEAAVFFGEDKLIELARRNAGGTADEITTAIQENVHQYIGEIEQQDDITLLVVKRVQE